MKYSILFFLFAFAVSARAQITLEHTYTDGAKYGVQFGLVQVDSGTWKYVAMNKRDTIIIYNINHSLDRIIHIPWVNPDPSTGIFLLNISKRLFDLDDASEYMVWAEDSTRQMVLLIFKEDGRLLFSCDTCQLINNGNYQSEIDTYIPSSFVTTDDGTKMITVRGYPGIYDVYSLPGKLPGCPSSTLGVSNPPSIAVSNPPLPTSAYPNPSNGRVRIAYELPLGISSGEIVLLSEDGKEVKRYMVTNAFNDLLIEAPELPSGSYFYKLVTEKGESAARRIILQK
jgi:hypothetical protein